MAHVPRRQDHCKVGLRAPAAKLLVGEEKHRQHRTPTRLPDRISSFNTRIRTLSRHVAMVLFPWFFRERERREVGRKQEGDGEEKEGKRKELEREQARDGQNHCGRT